MFTKIITFGPRSLTDPAADSELGHIGWAKFRGDESFGMTLRAMLHHRVDPEQPFSMQLKTTSVTKDLLDEDPEDFCEKLVSLDLLTGKVNDTLYIADIAGKPEHIERAIAHIDHVVGQHDGIFFRYTQPEEDFCVFFAQRKIPIRFLLDRENRNTIVLVGGMGMQHWHLIQGLIIRYLPWYFAEKPLTPEEMTFLKTCTNRYAPAYETACEPFQNIIDWRSADVKTKLKGFETVFDREKLDHVMREIADAERQRDNLRDQLEYLFSRYDDLLVDKLGLEAKIKDAGEESEIMSLFLACKSLDPVEVNGASLTFIVATTIASFDPDAAEAILHTTGSWLYRLDEYRDDGDPSIELTEEESVKLFRAVFLTEKLRARTIAAYKINFSTHDYRAIKDYAYPDHYRDFVPNMHFRRFNCFGQNRVMMDDALDRADYAGAVEGCINCAQNVAVEETTTTPYYWRRIVGEGAGKFLLLPDNTPVTPREALEWLNAQA